MKSKKEDQKKLATEGKMVKTKCFNKDDIKYYKLKYPDFSCVLKGRSITLKEPK